MTAFLGIAGGAWIFAGGYVLRNALELTTSVSSVLHQQYIVGELILGVVLASFGMLMIGLAGVIDALKREPAQRVTTCKRDRMVRGELVPSAWS
jgi:hypothetical protein